LRKRDFDAAQAAAFAITTASGVLLFGGPSNGQKNIEEQKVPLLIVEKILETFCQSCNSSNNRPQSLGAGAQISLIVVSSPVTRPSSGDDGHANIWTPAEVGRTKIVRSAGSCERY
jgi:hypothetical protein